MRSQKIDQFLNKLDGVKQTGNNQYQAKCPAHKDKVESFSVNITDEKINFYCHADCSENEILSAMNLKWSDIYFNDQKQTKKKEIVKTYNYENEKGDLLFQAVRFKPKSFRQRRPDNNGGWIWNLKNVDRVLYNLESVIKAIENGQVVYLVEGEKDADNLINLGLTATTSPMGAGKWKQSYTETLKGAKVVIIPDNDKPGIKHAEKVAEKLKGAAESVKLLNLPYLEEKQDVTDWLNQGFDKDDLKKYVEICPEFEKQEEFKDFNDFLPSPIAKEIIKKEKIKNNNIWKYVAESGLFYLYNNGYWESQNEHYLRKMIREYLKEYNEKWDKQHKVKELLEAFRSILLDPANDNLFNAGYNPNTDLINVKNGMLDWKNKKLIDHDPEYYSQFQLPVKYDPKAKCPLWKKSLKEWIPEKQARLFLQEYVGYSLIPDTSFHKFLILYGSGSNGKSTFLNVLIKLFDQKNISSLPLDSITQRFQTIRLKDKLVNICSDISASYLTETGILKGIVTGDPVNAEIKFGESFEFDPVVRLIFSANELPRSNDQTKAWYRRIEIVEFPNEFNKNDPDFDRYLDNKLIKELPGIFNWAVEGLKRLKKQDHFTESEIMKANKQDYEIENDNISAFIEFETEDSEESYEVGSKVYQYYKNYCMRNGFKPKSRHKFTHKLKEIGYETKVKRINGKSKRCYSGLELN